ncbi:MAG TPA: hypothetical protein VFT62_06455 [Mycobacteriales bacterium]|nr:hypothetical protein [Mycobacteriales bacterium]
MTYSLVNIAAVVRDAARRPTGALLATDLRRVLALGRERLAMLDAPAPAADAPARREVLLARCRAEPRALEVLGSTRAAARAAGRNPGPSAGLDTWAAALPRLEAAPLGSGDELRRWVRDELLAVAWERSGDLAVARWPRALDVVTDGLLATWLGCPDDELAAPWRAAAADLPLAEVGDTAVRSVITGVAAAHVTALAAAGAALRAAKADGWSWPVAMHEACWAVELTGRGSTAAAAQLAALQALLDVTGAPLLRADIVAAVTAAVHATVVADVLDGQTLAAMCTPLLARL